MYAICAALNTSLYIVIDDAAYTVAVAQLYNILCLCDEFLMRKTLFPDLYQCRTAFQALLDLLIQCAVTRPCAVGDGL